MDLDGRKLRISFSFAIKLLLIQNGKFNTNNLCQASDQDWWEGPWEVDTGRTAGQRGGRAGGAEQAAGSKPSAVVLSQH